MGRGTLVCKTGSLDDWQPRGVVYEEGRAEHVEWFGYLQVRLDRLAMRNVVEIIKLKVGNVVQVGM